MWNLFAKGIKKRDSPKGQLTANDDIKRVGAMVNHFLDAIAQKALPERRDMLTDDVVLLSASGPPTIGRDAVETLCRDLLDRFDIRHHVDFSVEVIEVENAACAYLAPLVTAMPLDGGPPVTIRGRGWALRRRENGAWKLRGLSWVSWVAPT